MFLPDASKPSLQGSTSRRGTLALFVASWAVAAVLAARTLFEGWIPPDEGLLGQTAARALAGELPHVDFFDVYTGGLAWLNAGAFALLGERLSSLRVPLYLAFVGALPAIWWLGRPRLRPWGAALMVLLCAAWGLPNYPAAMPSWYGLFLGLAGLAALRYGTESDRAWAFALAGLTGGLACVVKVTGLFFVAGGALFLVCHEAATFAPLAGGGRRSRVFFVLKAVALGLFVAALARTVGLRMGISGLFHLVAPAMAVALYAVWLEWRRGGGEIGLRMGRLGRRLGPFFAGAVVPIAVLLLPYAFRGQLWALYEGLFVLPQKRIDVASYPFPPVESLAAAVPYAAILAASLVTPRSPPRWALLLWVLALSLLLAFGHLPAVYRWVWYSARSLVPVAVALALVAVARPRTEMGEQQDLPLFACLASLMAFVQFPYASGIYFCYAVPFAALLVYALTHQSHPGFRGWHAAAGVFYLLFGVVWLVPGDVRAKGVEFVPARNFSLVLPERANLKVGELDQALYEELVARVRERAGADPFIYAAPDCPEIYFLTDKRNPTKKIYDLFDSADEDPESTIARLEEAHVRVAVLNLQPESRRPLKPELARRLRERFPQSLSVGWFELRWRP